VGELTATVYVRAEGALGVTDAVLDMVLCSPRLTGFAGGPGEVRRIVESIEDAWLEVGGQRVHVDVHQASEPRATIVFQPGSGAHAGVYFLMAGLFARQGYNVLAIDRPGHGASDGERGDCTIDEAIAASAAAIGEAASRWRLPVVLMGSSMGGLLTVFGLLRGLRPDLAVAHNFVYPGKLVSFRLRARWIRRYRKKPYPLTELVHGFEKLSDDPAVTGYLTTRNDPAAAWELSARGVASMFAFNAKAPATTPPLLLVSGAKDQAIPAWATRFFAWWSGIRDYEVEVLRGCGHLLFHDHLDVSVPLIGEWLDRGLAGLQHRPQPPAGGLAPELRPRSTPRQEL
jgi:alpha-beta hydrolase superfamily lysophospholipase